MRRARAAQPPRVHLAPTACQRCVRAALAAGHRRPPTGTVTVPAAQLDALLTALAHLHGVLLDQAIRLEEVEHDGAPFDHTTAWRDLAHAVDRRRQFPITRNPSP